MAVTYTTATAVRNRVENIDGSLTDDMIDEYIYQAESILDSVMGRSFVGSFDASKHKILAAAAQCWGAIGALQFDPSGMTSLAEAESIMDSLWQQWQHCLELLSDKDVVNYLESL